MNDNRQKEIANTHDTLRLFYTVILGAALAQGLIRFIDSPIGTSQQTDYVFLIEYGILVVFLLFIGRFFFGGVRHLDTYYDEMELENISTNSRFGFIELRHFVGLDILLLSLDAVFLFSAGVLITTPQQFFYIIAILLIIDAIWAVIFAVLFDIEKQDDTEQQEGQFTLLKQWITNIWPGGQRTTKTKFGDFTPETRWSINNTMFALLFSMIIFLNTLFFSYDLVPAFVVLGLLNSYFDFRYTYQYYFPF